MENRLTYSNGELVNRNRTRSNIALGGRAVAGAHSREQGLAELSAVINASDKLSADGTIAVASMIYPPSKWPNPGYPDGNTSCSTRANADLLTSIAPPGAANGTEKLWNCHIITNPGWYKTPVLVIAYINGYEDYVNRSPTSIGPQPDMEAGYNGVSCVGGDVYLDADMVATLGNGSTCVAYRKWMRDTKLSKFNDLLAWRCLSASTTTWMDCAELYKQGTVHGSHAPAPTMGQISIQDPAIAQIYDDGVYGPWAYSSPILGDQVNSVSLSANSVEPLNTGEIVNKTKSGCLGWNTSTKSMQAIPAGTKVTLDKNDTKFVNLSMLGGITSTSEVQWPYRKEKYYPFLSRGLDHATLETQYFDVKNATWAIAVGRALDVTSVSGNRYVFPDKVTAQDGSTTTNSVIVSPISGNHDNLKISGWGADQDGSLGPVVNTNVECELSTPQLNAAITNAVFQNANLIEQVTESIRYTFGEIRDLISKDYFADEATLTKSRSSIRAEDTTGNSYYISEESVGASSVNEFSNFGTGWSSSSQNYIIPLDKDTMQAYGYMISQPAAQGAFQICRLSKENNEYTCGGGQAKRAAAFFIEADTVYPIGNYGDPMMYGVGTESLTFVMGNGASYESPPQYSAMSLRQRNDGTITSNGAYKVAHGDPTAAPEDTCIECYLDEDTLPEVVASVNGLYNHMPSSDAWGTAVCLYEGLAGRAVIRLKCCRDLEIIPTTGTMALQKTSIPCLPDSIAREVGVRMLSCIPPLMRAEDNDLGSFISIVEKVGQIAAPIVSMVAPELAPLMGGMQTLFRGTQAMYDKTKALTESSSKQPITGVGRRVNRRQERRAARNYLGPVGVGAVGGGGWNPSSSEAGAVAAQARAGNY